MAENRFISAFLRNAKGPVPLVEAGILPPSDHRMIILPGFCDVHVHLREPGFSYKETIASGTAAAARTDMRKSKALRVVGIHMRQ